MMLNFTFDKPLPVMVNRNMFAIDILKIVGRATVCFCLGDIMI